MAEEEDSGGGIPEWVVTFGDMMSLLLTFFIMLVSLSEIKQEEKFQAIRDKQLPDDQKRQRADFVIDTGSGMEPARQAVAELIESLVDCSQS